MKYSWLVWILSLCSSCTNNDLKPLECVNYAIDLSSATEGLTFASLVDSAYYVELETTSANMIGEVSKIQVDSFIALSDRMSNTLHLYSQTGTLLSVISAIGNGPGEYVGIDDFIMQADKDEIHILDGAQNKIIVYSLAGKFLEERKIRLSPGIARFMLLGDNYVYDQQIRRNDSDSCFNLVVTSADGSIRNCYLPYAKSSDMILSPRNSLFSVNDTLVYLPTYSNTVYHVFDDKVAARYSFDFGSQWIDEEYLFSAIQHPMSFIDGLKATTGVYFFNVTESVSHLLLDYMYKGEKYGTVISKTSSTVNTYKGFSDSGCMLEKAPLASFGSFFVTSLSKAELPDLFSEEESEDSNPVLMFYKLNQI